jgi:uncharacterized membrane protein (DUF4010 family)
MTAPEAFQALGISLGLGLLAETLGGWVVAAGLLGVVAMLTMANVIKLREGDIAPGMTTEVAAQVMYCVGAYVVLGHRSVALAVGGAVVVMLYAKPALHGISARMGEGEMRGLIQFVLVALVILPILPDEPYGPFKVLNPRQIWWMVVLVSGISLSGYIAFRLLGSGKAAVVSGLLGGLISSTATTVSYARRAAEDAGRVPAAALVIMLASTVVYARVLLEVSLVARPVLPSVAGPIAVMLASALLLSAFAWLRARRAEAELSPDNPTELRAAVSFGVLFALVLLAVAAAKEYFGDRGLYAVAAISGLTDMDAITLSTSRMSAEGALSPATAWRAIVVAAIANLVFKCGIVAVLGGRRLLARVALLFGFNVLVGALLLVLWPG